MVLACLIPTLPAAGADFIRIERNENRDPAALQTAIAKYVPTGGQQGVEIDLVAVVHIGEKAYYERLNKGFEKYDAVLYELVAPEGNKPPIGWGEEERQPGRHAPAGHEAFPAAGTST